MRIGKGRALRLAGLTFVLLSAGVVAYLVGGESAGLQQAVAQNPPLPPGTPPITDTNRNFDEDWGKPDFVGTLNGFRFYDPNVNPPKPEYECAEVREATKAEIDAANINFSAGYLPDGMNLVREEGALCDGQVTSLVRTYMDADNRVINVKRQIRNEAVVMKDAPEERLQATTLGGKLAVVKMPVVPKDRSSVYVKDVTTLWSVGGFQIDLDEVIKVAESLK
jgi:uncharacterized protein DUF4367